MLGYWKILEVERNCLLRVEGILKAATKRATILAEQRKRTYDTGRNPL